MFSKNRLFLCLTDAGISVYYYGDKTKKRHETRNKMKGRNKIKNIKNIQNKEQYKIHKPMY